MQNDNIDDHYGFQISLQIYLFINEEENEIVYMKCNN